MARSRRSASAAEGVCAVGRGWAHDGRGVRIERIAQRFRSSGAS